MTLMQKEIFEEPKALKACYDYNEAELKRLAEKLRNSDICNVYVAARGTSDHAGIYGKYLIESMVGVPVGLAAASTITLYGGKINFKNNLVIGISQSGAAADVLEVIKMAKASGAVTLTITNTLGSPLAEAADFHLYCNAGLESSVAATKTFTTQLYLMAQLAAVWADDKKLSEDLQAVPANLEKFFEKNDEIAELVKRYRFMTENFYLSRGICWPLALEAALKIQETNYVRARAYPISDFHHGPFAMIEEGTPVVMFVPNGPAAEDSKAMIEKLKNVGADILMVSDSDELLAEGTVSFKIPSANGSDAISAFYYAAFAQLFACNLTAVKGRNPDAPRGLNKVTITK